MLNCVRRASPIKPARQAYVPPARANVMHVLSPKTLAGNLDCVAGFVAALRYMTAAFVVFAKSTAVSCLETELPAEIIDMTIAC